MSDPLSMQNLPMLMQALTAGAPANYDSEDPLGLGFHPNDLYGLLFNPNYSVSSLLDKADEATRLPYSRGYTNTQMQLMAAHARHMQQPGREPGAGQ